MQVADSTVHFAGFRCSVHLARYCYAPDQIAIQLRDADSGEPVATATAAVPEQALPSNLVLIKSYSENEGMLDALVAAGLVRDTGERVPSGRVQLAVCELLAAAPAS